MVITPRKKLKTSLQVDIPSLLMASDNFDLARALAAYGRESAANLANLRTWRDAAINDLVAGKGSQLVTGSGSGLNFTMNPSTTIAEWFRALQSALDQASSGQRVTSVQIIF